MEGLRQYSYPTVFASSNPTRKILLARSGASSERSLLGLTGSRFQLSLDAASNILLKVRAFKKKDTNDICKLSLVYLNYFRFRGGMNILFSSFSFVGFGFRFCFGRRFPSWVVKCTEVFYNSAKIQILFEEKAKNNQNP